MFEAKARALDESRALRFYAVALALAHALTGIAFFAYKHVATLASGDDCVCWPLFPSCHELRPFLSVALVRAWVTGYVMLALGSALLFATRRPRAGLTAFVIGCVVGAIAYGLDYRMRFNQVTMLAWATLVFWAVRRPQAQMGLVALFYFWAGTLKLDREWMSGAALYAKPLFVPAALVPVACVYVVVLELVLVWGLFARSTRVRWVTLAQLVVFHAVSWTVVGYYYPVLMLCLLAVFPLVWKLAPEDALTFDVLREPRVWRPVAATTAAFSAFQLPPLFIPGDSALTGEGRIFALHMFDARIECSGGATLSRDGQRAFVPVINPKLDTRTQCDPIVLFETTKRLCRALSAQRDAARVDLSIDAKRTTAAEKQSLVRVEDFCARDLSYSVFGHNPWIATPGR